MLTKHLAWAVVGATLVAVPALAQNTPPANPSSSQPGQSAQAPAPGSGNWMTQLQPGMWRTSKLEGLDVYNNNDEKIGEIRELLVDSSGDIKAVVIGVGGFLGIGEHDVAVPFDQVKFVNEPRASRTAAANPGSTTAPPASTNPPANPAANNQGAANTTGSVSTTGSDADRGAPDHALVNMNKDQLKAAPEFKYTRS